MSWPLVKLGSIGEFKAGYGFPHQYQGKASGDMPFAKVGDISEVARRGDKYISKARNFINKEELSQIKAKSIPVNTIVFAKIGEAIRQNFRAVTSVETVIDNNSMGLVPNLHLINVDYLYHFMCKLDLYRYTGATTVPAIRKSTLEEIEIPLPPLDEQKRIATILDKTDAIRRKRHQAIDLADDFLRSAFLDMFGDPVTNPKGWAVKAIKELATVTTGNTPSRKVPEYYGNDVEWIKSDNINTPHHILTSAKEYLSNEGLKVARTVPKGSTLITCIAGSFDCIGNAAFTDREVSFNQQINALTPKDGVLSWFLYALIIFSKTIIQNASTNSMKGMVSKGKLEEVKLFLPPLELQKKFEDIFYKEIGTVSRMNNSDKYSNELFNSISQKAFAGDL